MNKELLKIYSELRPSQQEMILKLARTLNKGAKMEINSKSDFVSRNFGYAFGDLLLAHNMGSQIPLTKDKFEFAIVAAFIQCGHRASKVPNGNPGEDVIVDGIPWSLKTQADRHIQEDFIHISKFMELGRGRWETEDDIRLLQERMFTHLEAYERIFTLRCFTKSDDSSTTYTYELVEIPKALFLMSRGAEIQIQTKSRQSPKPAYIHVEDSEGARAYSLYFDGGTERKLQIKKINKSLCMVHATWEFTVT